MNNFNKVGRENSRFRALMAAQLNAAAGESLYLGPKPTDPQVGKEDEPEASKTEHRPRTDQHAVWFIFVDNTGMYVSVLFIDPLLTHQCNT